MPAEIPVCSGELSIATGVPCSTRPVFAVQPGQSTHRPVVHACAHHLAQVVRREAGIPPKGWAGSPVAVWSIARREAA